MAFATGAVKAAPLGAADVFSLVFLAALDGDFLADIGETVAFLAGTVLGAVFLAGTGFFTGTAVAFFTGAALTALEAAFVLPLRGAVVVAFALVM
jgi:hypothetical protein